MCGAIDWSIGLTTTEVQSIQCFIQVATEIKASKPQANFVTSVDRANDYGTTEAFMQQHLGCLLNMQNVKIDWHHLLLPFKDYHRWIWNNIAIVENYFLQGDAIMVPENRNWCDCLVDIREHSRSEIIASRRPARSKLLAIRPLYRLQVPSEDFDFQQGCVKVPSEDFDFDV